MAWPWSRLANAGRSLGVGRWTRRSYWWGHDTIEEQSQRKLLAQLERQVIKASPGDLGTQDQSGSLYSPTRIMDEASVLVRDESLNFATTKYWAYMARPFMARLFHRDFYHAEVIRKTYLALIESQLFVRGRFTTLGPDLAAAHFLCHRNCRVRFVGQDDWTELDERGQLSMDMPNVYQPGWFVECIDAAESGLVFEGYQNLRNLIHLRYLDISYTPTTDDWVLDRITHEYSASLEYLDLSGCGGVNLSGLEALWRLRKLKILVLYDMDHLQDLGLLCLYLLDLFPNLEIRGVEYIDPHLLEGTCDAHLLADLETTLSLPLPTAPVSSKARPLAQSV
eukprot:snap_masked-scaffold1455_size40601-processed-gene-0.10 protein:Tk02968 transcript:snap_masked-scaffold1455_size40601-processed-gene-0.10-mRNA-1 annotation:"atp synthase subunit s-like protein"